MGFNQGNGIARNNGDFVMPKEKQEFVGIRNEHGASGSALGLKHGKAQVRQVLARNETV